MNRHPGRRSRMLLATLAALSLGVLAACSSSGSSSSSSSSSAASSSSASASSSSSSSTVSTSACGTKPGVAATGTPINIGAIATEQNGTDFSDIENMAGAYFACVNANGGINGHPIKYFPLTEQTNPSQITSLAKQLITSDHVVGIVGNISLIECTVDQGYWKSLGVYTIDAGIAPEC